MPTIDSDVFISHATEDKIAIRPLLSAMENLSISYWIDEMAIGWGERILNKIEKGLSSSKLVIVYITEDFINKRWTKTELALACEREIETGEVVVLPIVAIPHRRYQAEFPALAGKKYLSGTTPPNMIAEQLAALLNREFSRDWVYHHRPEYHGSVWIEVRATKANHNITHRYKIAWGPWRRAGSLRLPADESVALLHTKGNDGLSVPLEFTITPECFVRFGEGSPVATRTVRIINWWVKTKNAITLYLVERLLWR